jgi:hypothetical protein
MRRRGEEDEAGIAENNKRRKMKISCARGNLRRTDEDKIKNVERTGKTREEGENE